MLRIRCVQLQLHAYAHAGQPEKVREEVPNTTNEFFLVSIWSQRGHVESVVNDDERHGSQFIL